VLISFPEITCVVIIVSEYKLYTFVCIINTLCSSEYLSMDSRPDTGKIYDKQECLHIGSVIVLSQLCSRCGVLTYYDGVTRGLHLQRSRIYHILCT